MSETESAWYICNSKTLFQSNPMTWAEVQTHFSEIVESDVIFWNIWQETWPDWRPVTEISSLLTLTKRIQRPPIPSAPQMQTIALPPVPEAPALPLVAQMPLEPRPAVVLEPRIPVTSDAPPKAPTPMMYPPEKTRKYPRFDIRLRVIIRSDRTTFRTFSKNISLGGISLEHAIPAKLFAEGCHIFIASPSGEHNLKFDLGPTSRNDMRFFSFSNPEEKFANQLSNWLANLGPPPPVNVILPQAA